MRTHIDLFPDMLDFDRSAKPLYIQIEGLLFDLIKCKKLKKGDMLPPISAMAESLEVDRLTVRRAIQALEAKQIVKSFRGRGKGIVVTHTHKTPPKMQLDTELKTLISYGVGSKIKVIDSTLCSPDSFFSLKEGIKAGSYQRIRRVHSKDGYLYGYFNLYIASDIYDLAPGEIDNKLAIDAVIDLAGRDNVASAYQHITIDAASKEEANRLSIAVGAPIARTQRVICNTSNVAIYANDIVYPGEFFELRVKLGLD